MTMLWGDALGGEDRGICDFGIALRGVRIWEWDMDMDMTFEFTILNLICFREPGCCPQG